MVKHVNAEVIAIGTEILLGEITDTNSVFIAQQLRDIGINLYFMTSVGDNESRISDSIRIAFSRAQVVITCGGLGPTVDDMTRQSVAKATERGLTFHQELLDQIAARFASFRAQMTENNRQQAYLPDNAIVIENPVGTAPAFIVEHGDRVVISLPGVPREMKFLLTDRVIPYLRQRFQLNTEIIKARVLRTAGIGESLLDEIIGKPLLEASNPTIGLAAHSGQVDVRITAKAASEVEADLMIAEVESQLRTRIGEYIYGIDKELIEDALLQALERCDAVLAISETGIDNVLSRRIAVRSGAEQRLSGTESYAAPNDLRAVLGGDIQLTLRQMAEKAAEAVCKQYGASVGIAIVSRPDIDERSDVDEGTALAVYTPTETRSRSYGFGGQSDIAQAWASTWSMSNAWRMLVESQNER